MGMLYGFMIRTSETVFRLLYIVTIRKFQWKRVEISVINKDQQEHAASLVLGYLNNYMRGSIL